MDLLLFENLPKILFAQLTPEQVSWMKLSFVLLAIPNFFFLSKFFFNVVLNPEEKPTMKTILRNKYLYISSLCMALAISPSRMANYVANESYNYSKSERIFVNYDGGVYSWTEVNSKISGFKSDNKSQKLGTFDCKDQTYKQCVIYVLANKDKLVFN